MEYMVPLKATDARSNATNVMVFLPINNSGKSVKTVCTRPASNGIIPLEAARARSVSLLLMG